MSASAQPERSGVIDPSPRSSRLLLFMVGLRPKGEAVDFLGSACRALVVLGLVSLGLATVAGKALDLAPAVVAGLVALALVPLLVGWLGMVARPSQAMLLAMAIGGYAIVDLTVRTGAVDPGRFDLQSIVKGLFWLNALAICGLHGWRSFRASAVLVLFLAYAAYAAMSALYSPASWLLAIGGATALLAMAALGFVVASFDEDAIDRLWKGIFVTMALIAAVSFLLYFIAPAWARDYGAAGAGRLRGLTGSGNGLGPLMASGVIAGLFVIRVADAAHIRAAALAGIGLCIACLLLSQSRTAQFSMLLALGVTTMLRYPVLMVPTALIATLVAWAMQYPGLMESNLAAVTALVTRTGDVHELTSVTGRSEIWVAVVGLIERAPWFGYGLASPRILIAQQPISRWNVYESSHNWLLESLLSFGIVGTALLALFLVVLGRMLWQLLRRTVSKDDLPTTRSQSALALCMVQMFIFTIASGLTEKAFAGMPHPSAVLLVLMAATAVVMQRSLSVAHPARSAHATRRVAPWLGSVR